MKSSVVSLGAPKSYVILPTEYHEGLSSANASGETRTPDLALRRRSLYPLSYKGNKKGDSLSRLVCYVLV
jgi:hypothetical protein